MLFGGAPLDGPRHLWWNFVSSFGDAHRAGEVRLESGSVSPGTGRNRAHSVPRALNAQVATSGSTCRDALSGRAPRSCRRRTHRAWLRAPRCHRK
ncbi:MAG: hypothetical protein ABIR79_25645 [Candidatus Binatia bacterium]